MTTTTRLGLNEGSYRGETIDLREVLDGILGEARENGWTIETMDGAVPGLYGLKRPCFQPRHTLYLSAGLHGDEPAGPLAALELLRLNRWPPDADLWLCPCLNPAGFPLNRRENASGMDLNRDYRHLATPEVKAHVAWLARQPRFDTCVGLHEDWEAQGFYLYELNKGARASRAEKIIEAVARVCPIEESTTIEGRPAVHGCIRPGLDPAVRPQWPEAFYLIQNKTPLSYTLEAPSDFHLPVRIQALVTAVQTIMAVMSP